MTHPSERRDRVESAVTALFVPASRPERFKRAAAEGDVAIFDLEDGVAAEDKEAARDAVVSALAAGTVESLVRLNGAGSEHHALDLAAVRQLRDRNHGLLGIILPKTESAADLGGLSTILGAADELPVVALIESARGVMAAADIAAEDSVVRLAFGAIDYSFDIDSSMSAEVLAFPRSMIVNASRAAGIAGPLHSPSLDIRDLEAVARDAARARSFGFTGQFCIHPAQIGPVAEAFGPNSEDIAWARKIVALDTEGARQLDGLMIDAPLVKRARRIIGSADS